MKTFKKHFLLFSIAFLCSIPVSFAVTAIVFPDVPRGSFFEDGVMSLVEKGVLKGYSDGTFKPGQAVNRAEMAVTIDRLIRYLDTREVSDISGISSDEFDARVDAGIERYIERMQKEAEQRQQAQQTDTAAPLPKSDKPTVELFVMSHCPYGTQAEKGILPAVRTLGDSIDFDVKFVNYVMHGQKEIDEQLYQYCIMKEQPDVYLSYLACFLKEGDSDACSMSIGVDSAKVSTCVSITDEQYKITENSVNTTYPKFPIYDADNVKYGVQGSPTLIINGTKSTAGRSPASYLKGICSAFHSPPAACNTVLSSDTPGTGFGYASTADATAAGCGAN